MFVKALKCFEYVFCYFIYCFIHVYYMKTLKPASTAMDQSISESDISLSPSQLLERLQLLRQLQLLQRGKLQKQRLEYQQSPESSPKLSEIVSQFTSTTSYEAFRSVLQISGDTRSEETPPHKEHSMSNMSQKVREQDLVDGVAVLNLSQESEFILNSSESSRGRGSVSSKTDKAGQSPQTAESSKCTEKKIIQLDDIPILTPKKDFETLLLERLQNEKKAAKPVGTNPEKIAHKRSKQPFLRRGEGTARFGLRKNDLVILPTKSLPWKKKSLHSKSNSSDKPVKRKVSSLKPMTKRTDKVHLEISGPQRKKKLNFDVNDHKLDRAGQKKSLTIKSQKSANEHKLEKTDQTKAVTIESKQNSNNYLDHMIDSHNCEIHGDNKTVLTKLEVPTFKKNQITKHPLFVNKGKTWAAVLTNEQGDFLRQLKQTNYYKNYTSPAKSIASDTSCDDNLIKLRQEREAIEQNMFDLLENKVSHESFSLENSFFSNFFKKSQMQCSGESTPLVLQKCLAKNPQLLHLQGISKGRHCEEKSDTETNDSEYTEYDHETCSSDSECCSCKTIEEASHSCCKNEEKNISNDAGHKETFKKVKLKEVNQPSEKVKDHNDTVIQNDNVKENMAEMNAKLVATSELLKERLKELEDEIETFRKENNNLATIRGELDQERQKFYEDKASFEQKFNEEKILSEYYLSEEKEKLEKQKQMYEKYVREMRGRLNKKEKDEVINLKKEICGLKEEIRIKDAKSTTTMARLRNQLKIAEREKTHLQEEIEKLQKVNKRLHHSNEMTRRMTNIKYLQEISKKLHADTKVLLPEVNLDSDAKYKDFEIETQIRGRKVARQSAEPAIRTRAKSVPNLNVTSRYAKYFSQRDVISQMDGDKTLHTDQIGAYGDSDLKKRNVNESFNLDHSGSIEDEEEEFNNDMENNLEKLYNERFKSTSPRSDKSSLSNSNSATNLSHRNSDQSDTHNGYFLRKSNGPSENSSSRSASPYLFRTSDGTRSPVSAINQRLSNMDQDRLSDFHNKTTSHYGTRPQSPNGFGNNIQEYQTAANTNSVTLSKSPISILSNRSCGSQKSVANPKDATQVIGPSSSKSSISKTSLNPTEIKRPDGTREFRFPNGNVKYITPDGKYTKFVYYNGDIKENFYNNGTIKYFYAETKTYHTTHSDGLEVLEFPDGQVEKRYKDGSAEIRLPNGSVRYSDPNNRHVREEWRFPDGTTMTVSATGEQRVTFLNGQVEVHASDHKRREFPDGTVKLVYNDGTSETRYSSGRVRIKDKHGNLIMDSAPR